MSTLNFLNSLRKLMVVLLNSLSHKKCIPKGACHGCLPRGTARALQIQRQMLAATIGLGLGSPMEELEGGLEELKGFRAPWEKQ